MVLVFAKSTLYDDSLDDMIQPRQIMEAQGAVHRVRMDIEATEEAIAVAQRSLEEERTSNAQGSSSASAARNRAVAMAQGALHA